MPYDNLENLFKQKVTEGQHTPPPISWNQEAAWQKLKPTLKPNREKRIGKFYYGVAAGIILLMSIAISFLSLKNQPAANLAITSNKAEKLVSTTTPEPAQNVIKLRPNTNLKSKNYAAKNQDIVDDKVVIRRRRKASKQQIIVRKPELKSSIADEELTNLPKTELVNNLVLEQTAVAQAPVAKSIKITIVLGARTVAKIDSAGKEKRAIAKNKLRLKMNLPGADIADYNQMATNNSYYKPLTLETKIKL